MDKKRIGINYNVSSSWIGGKYYLDCIIKVLKKRDDVEVILLKKSYILRVVGKIFGLTSKIYTIINNHINDKLNLDVVFPYSEYNFSGKRNIAWIPDFQENYYPEYFDKTEIIARLKKQVGIAYSDNILVLSSYSAKNDFYRLFPKCTCKVFVLQFISLLADVKDELDYNVLDKYNINKPFFLCSNQLWKHKNHITLIHAIEKTKEDILCICTGKEEDFRDTGYPQKLKNTVLELGLDKKIKFLGFIPRCDQVELMKKSIAIIQPSLFEGWNTTIEDAKVLGKSVIASNIEVHREQLNEKGVFFDFYDSTELVHKMEELLLSRNNIDYDYKQQVLSYEKNVVKIFLDK